MGEEYKDKQIDIIKKDITEKFKKNEDRWDRDDKEIYEAGKKVIDDYIRQLSNARGKWVDDEKRLVIDGKAKLITSENKYKEWALRYFRQAKTNLTKRYKEIEQEKKGLFGMRITSRSENEKHIQDVAESIDKAEKDALRKIQEYCNPKQELDNAINNNNIARDKQGNIKVNQQGEIIKQDPLFIQERDGTLTLTKKTNPLKIHQVLGNLFKDKGVIYTIDYSGCKNLTIKNNMEKIIKGPTCLIKYDEKSQTYHLTDENGNILSNRALIWEGVRVKKADINQQNTNSGSNENDGSDNNPTSSLDNSRNTPEPYTFNADDYKYYLQYRDYIYQQEHKKLNLCSAYAYGVVSDILTKRGCYFPAQNVSAWEIASSRHIKGKFNVNKINDSNPQKQIIDAPAGTFLTVRFNGTSARDTGVSHAMVSLGNGVYTDLFGSKIRTIDFKSQTKFSGKSFYFGGGSYTLTEDSRLITPDYNNIDPGLSKTIEGNNVTPNSFADQVSESTGLDNNYVRLLIARQNNISIFDFGKRAKKLSVNIVSKEIRNLNLDNNEGSNSVAEDFLDSLKKYKPDIMKYQPKLTNREYDELAERAMGILYQESNATGFRNYDGTFSRGNLSLRGKETAHSIINIARQVISRGSDSFSSMHGYSRGYTQIKFNQMFSDKDKEFLQTMGVNSDNDLMNAEKCGIATMVGLIGKYYDYVVPMKSDPFRTNDAEITEIKFKDGNSELIAKEKAVPINGKKRKRTEDEIQKTINNRGDKHGGISSTRTFTRYGIKDDGAFFDYIYYARNKPSEIDFGTATIGDNNYRNRAADIIAHNTTGGNPYNYSQEGSVSA